MLFPPTSCPLFIFNNSLDPVSTARMHVGVGLYPLWNCEYIHKSTGHLPVDTFPKGGSFLLISQQLVSVELLKCPSPTRAGLLTGLILCSYSCIVVYTQVTHGFLRLETLSQMVALFGKVITGSRPLRSGHSWPCFLSASILSLQYEGQASCTCHNAFSSMVDCIPYGTVSQRKPFLISFFCRVVYSCNRKGTEAEIGMRSRDVRRDKAGHVPKLGCGKDRKSLEVQARKPLNAVSRA